MAMIDVPLIQTMARIGAFLLLTHPLGPHEGSRLEGLYLDLLRAGIPDWGRGGAGH
jgi:hypothetical protein